MSATAIVAKARIFHNTLPLPPLPTTNQHSICHLLIDRLKLTGTERVGGREKEGGWEGEREGGREKGREGERRRREGARRKEGGWEGGR